MVIDQNVFEYELPLKIKPQKEGGYIAICPLWPDCYAQGESIDEVILEITGVAQSLIELYKEEGLRIPLKITSKKKLGNQLFVPIIVSA